MPQKLPDGYIWLDKGEESGSAECGCQLIRHHKCSGDPALILCPMHETAPDLLAALEALMDDLHFNSEKQSWSIGPISEMAGGRIDKARAAIAMAKKENPYEQH